MISIKMTSCLRRWISGCTVVLLLAGCGLMAGCDKAAELEADMEPTRSSSRSTKAAEVTEQHDDATVSWAVSSSGDVQVTVKPDGKERVVDGVSGALTVKPFGATAEPKVVALQVKGRRLVADIGKLEADLTEVRYEIGVQGRTLKGVLHLPPGGTSQLIAGAKTAEKAGVDLTKKGPQGGLLQVVGTDLVEVVGNKRTGELRIYLLDDELKPMPVGEREMKVGLYGSPAEMVTLKASVDGTFFLGKLKHNTNPAKITLWMKHKSNVHVVICHHHPGKVIHIGQPHHLAVYVVHEWHGVHAGHGHGHHKHRHYKHKKHKHYKHKKHKHYKHKKHKGHGKPRVTISF